MIIANKFVRVQQDKNIVELHNLILNKYLELFSKTQYESEDNLYEDNYNKNLSRCYVKFDNKLENINPNIELTAKDFDIEFTSITTIVEFNNQEAHITYNYGTRVKTGIYDISAGKYIDNLSPYVGKKITALAFGSPSNIYAVIETINYSLTVDTSDNFNIFREDIFKSDAICDKYPYHLSPIGKGSIILDEDYSTANVYAKLYSIGLGKIIGGIEEELVVGKDIEINVKNNTTFSFNLKKGSANNIYPRNIQPSYSKYPLALYVETFKFPHDKAYPSSSKYPMETDYRYIIYKYQLYYIGRGNELVTLDEYYTMSYLTDVKGLFEIETKIERNDDINGKV